VRHVDVLDPELLHLRPPGFFCGGPDGLQFFPGRFAGHKNRRGQLLTLFENVFFLFSRRLVIGGRSGSYLPQLLIRKLIAVDPDPKPPTRRAHDPNRPTSHELPLSILCTLGRDRSTAVFIVSRY